MSIWLLFWIHSLHPYEEVFRNVAFKSRQGEDFYSWKGNLKKQLLALGSVGHDLILQIVPSICRTSKMRVVQLAFPLYVVPGVGSMIKTSWLRTPAKHLMVSFKLKHIIKHASRFPTFFRYFYRDEGAAESAPTFTNTSCDPPSTESNGLQFRTEFQALISNLSSESILCFLEMIHHMDEVNDELLKKITNIKIQPPQRHFRVEKSQQALVPLTFESSTEEVKAWLEAKSFSKG